MDAEGVGLAVIGGVESGETNWRIRVRARRLSQHSGLSHFVGSRAELEGAFEGEGMHRGSRVEGLGASPRGTVG